MTEMFETLGTWNWLIFGFILMLLELAAPGVFLFWLGLAALLVGLVSFGVHPFWQAQLLMFAVFAAADQRGGAPVQERVAAHSAPAKPPPDRHGGRGEHRKH